MTKKNKLIVPGVEQSLQQSKYEIAQEFGAHLGGETNAHANDSSEEITKKLINESFSQTGPKQTE